MVDFDPFAWKQVLLNAAESQPFSLDVAYTGLDSPFHESIWLRVRCMTSLTVLCASLAMGSQSPALRDVADTLLSRAMYLVHPFAAAGLLADRDGISNGSDDPMGMVTVANVVIPGCGTLNAVPAYYELALWLIFVSEQFPGLLWCVRPKATAVRHADGLRSATRLELWLSFPGIFEMEFIARLRYTKSLHVTVSATICSQLSDRAAHLGSMTRVSDVINASDTEQEAY